MKFEEFIKIVANKVGANSAFDLLRDAQLKTFENLLIEKGIATEEEVEAEREKQLGEIANNIVKMPTFPGKNLSQKDNQENTNESK